MRHWRNALEYIHESRVTNPASGRDSLTDTEKTLVGAIKELELQCKERIDLLGALRVSRQELQVAPPGEKPSPQPASDESTSSNKGSIGEGTIPAVALSDLSRPLLPSRSFPPARMSSENAVIGGGGSGGAGVTFASTSSASPPHPWPESSRSSSKDDQIVRPSSPEKHTMRTTLRSGRVGEKLAKPTRKSPAPVAEGPSKAATLAWSALGPRDRLRKAHSSDGGPSTSTSSPRKSSDRPLKSGAFQPQWDSHSRRLVVPRDSDSSTHNSSSPRTPRHLEESPCPKPSLLSVTAASSAVSSSSNQGLASSGRLPSRVISNPSSQSALVAEQSSRPSTYAHVNGTKSADEPKEVWERKGTATPARRQAAARRPEQAARLVGITPDRERANRAPQVELLKIRPASVSSSSENESTKLASRPWRAKQKELVVKDYPNSSSSAKAAKKGSSHSTEKIRYASILENLPPGIDEAAAKQILNEIVVQGDEVHWGDVAGLEIAKNALRETVVYPFLRPDLFMGLREPARGMLLFGPPGTGKTMLARAVATESKSTFFSISASSLTSKYLGESEKLVRALFGLARVLAPSIIFVDEIDSLLSQRSGSGEHEATRRIKTEFLIQWSDLQRAAAGRDITERDKERGDANRVLVLAATNLPWAIDEAARRRFVRRQYIPLPEPRTRETQLRTLLRQQKHNLASSDVQNLVDLTEGELQYLLRNRWARRLMRRTTGFSGSDITALAKDAAMGPLRSLGEALLHMTMDEIRPIMLQDFEASLGTIRPSVSKAGLKEYEDWAKEFGERGG